MTSNRSADAADPLVRGQRKQPSVALAPEVDERGREQRQPAGLARDVVDERIDKRWLDVQPGPLRRPFDRAAQLGVAHRPEEDVVRPDQIGELDVRCDVPEEVGPQRKQNDCPALRIPGDLDQGIDVVAPGALRERWAEELLELVDRDDGATGRECRQWIARPQQYVVEVDERGQQTSAEERRFAASGRTDQRKQWRLCEARGKLVDQPLSPKEELRVGRFERRQALVGTDVAFARRETGTVRSEIQPGVLREDRALELLQLAAGLEPEFVVQKRACPPIDLEALCLTARPVEREHQLSAKALAVRMLRAQRLDLADQRELTAERQLRIDSLLDAGKPQLFQTLDLDACKRLELEVGERPAFPERLRLTE